MAQGTITDPLTLSEALGHARIAPGHTIWLRAGTYTGNFATALQGQEGAAIAIKPYPGETVTTDGSLALGATARYLDAIGRLVITDSSYTDRTQSGGAALAASGDNNRIINLIIRNGGQGVASATDHTDCLFYGCLIQHCGWLDAANAYGHGVYLQNAVGTKKVDTCILCDQFGYNFHIYGTAAARLDNLVVRDNIVFNCGVYDSYRHNTYNLHIGGTEPFDSPLVDGNVFYSGPNRIGYGIDNIVTNAIITNNYFANPGGVALRLTTCVPTTMTGNTFIGTVSGFDPEDYPDNTYLVADAGLKTFVFPNAHDSNEANLAIYNWDEDDSVDLDVSAAYSDGDALTLHNAQDYEGDTAEVIVAGDGTISVDMRAASHSVLAPVGVETPCATTFPTFGAFIAVQTA